jgi:hypothetical protein
MKKIVLAAVAVGALACVSAASAQDDEKVWLSTQSGKQMIMGGGGPAEGTELIVGTGVKPADCPPGHYYTTDSSQQMVVKCDDDARFSLTNPEAGATMGSGEPYPTGSKILTPAS